MNNGRVAHNTHKEGRVAEEVRRGDELAYLIGGADDVPGVGVVGEAGCDGLAGGAGINAFGRGWVELGVRVVDEDRGGVDHHMGLEHHLIYCAVDGNGIFLGVGEV